MARNCPWIRSAVMASEEDEGGRIYLSGLPFSVTGSAMELAADTVQVCIGLTVMGTLGLSRVDTGPGWHVSALTLLLGHGWAGELVVNGLDRPVDPLGPALCILFSRNEGSSLLGCVLEEGLHSVLGEACVSDGVRHQHNCLEAV